MTEQPKEYYDKKPGFVIKSGTKDRAGKTTDISIITDNAQGFQYTTEGNKFDACNKTSYEVCGKEGTAGKPSKVIRAEIGDITIEAVSGDIILKGMNIRIVAKDGSGEITLSSPKQISLDAPIQSVKGGNINVVGTNNVALAAQAVDTTGNIQNTANSGAEEGQSSLLTKVLGALKKFKDFFA